MWLQDTPESQKVIISICAHFKPRCRLPWQRSCTQQEALKFLMFFTLLWAKRFPCVSQGTEYPEVLFQENVIESKLVQNKATCVEVFFKKIDDTSLLN